MSDKLQVLIEDFIGEASSLKTKYSRASAKAVQSYTDPRAAKKMIVGLAKGTSRVYDFMQDLHTNYLRSDRGSTAAGAFPHEPNPKVTKMYGDLLGLFTGVRAALRKKGFASDEREDRMAFMLDRVRKGDLMQRETVKSLLRQID